MKSLIKTSDLCITTNEKRVLIKDLNMSLSLKEQVAIIGRNGVGKSTLLNTLSGKTSCKSGKVVRYTKPYFIKQHFDSLEIKNIIKKLANYSCELVEKELVEIGLPCLEKLARHCIFSCGEFSKIKMLVAKLEEPQLLILDEPTQHLDERGILWLRKWLKSWSNGLIIVSHDTTILCEFSDFFMISEQGCRYFNGTFSQLQKTLEEEQRNSNKRYLQNLQRMIKKEQKTLDIARRKGRKKRYGRISELQRATPRQRLNQKRDYAQCQHGKAKKIREQRISTLRTWTKKTRRALNVDLPLVLPQLQFETSNLSDIVTLDNAAVCVNSKYIYKNISLCQCHERTAIVGKNGAGKTTLIRTILGEIEPTVGKAQRISSRIGYIAQNASNWIVEESLLVVLLHCNAVESLEVATELIIAHKFPLALAERPLCSLSPGERIRAALICLFQQIPTTELLVLDEPTANLDILGQQALTYALQSWRAGFIITSHNTEFLKAIAVERYLQL
ncbi:ATP-binding cassette domain-containing protein [Candidatus Uabimicrobium sp. HlEnr_7]|uniref:ATP-binding cassette domain-containing protein n=1 Tax=Candidatus Uabimicrobium helgolandensis TaxID=3095367 RepID=UPI003557D766